MNHNPITYQGMPFYRSIGLGGEKKERKMLGRLGVKIEDR